jgi:branched-chain amino acid aminotransferase
VTTKVWMNGEVSGADAAISVFDRGFLYGDSVYEVMRTSGGRPVDLEPHLARLHRSAASLLLEIPGDAALRAALEEVLAAAGNGDSYIRVVVTRGAGEVGLDTALADSSTLIVIVRPLVLPPAEMYERGAALQIVGVQRTSLRSMDPGVKSGNYLNNIMGLMEAKRAGAYEALMCNPAGLIAEGSSSNVFVVRDGDLSTPAIGTGLLAGITRQRVIELSRANGFAVSEGEILPEDVRGADEVFITSSVRGVMPAASIDGEPLAGAPGPVTRRVMELYAQHLRSEAP